MNSARQKKNIRTEIELKLMPLCAFIHLPKCYSGFWICLGLFFFAFSCVLEFFLLNGW